MTDLRDLTRQFDRPGRLEAIYLRPARDVPVRAVDAAEAVAGRGLLGDRTGDRGGVTPPGKRQVTMMQAEHVPLIARWTGHDALDAGILRRNLLISGLNLMATRSPFPRQAVTVRIGETVILVVTGDCAPCSKMEIALGRGGYNALRGHGGVTARIVQGGLLRVGDAVRVDVGAESDDRPRA